MHGQVLMHTHPHYCWPEVKSAMELDAHEPRCVIRAEACELVGNSQSLIPEGRTVHSLQEALFAATLIMQLRFCQLEVDKYYDQETNVTSLGDLS